jgi:tetratricopeptide (TPR) repeat protein
MRNRYVQAIYDLSMAIELDPANAVFYYNRGSTYYETGLIDKAVSDYNMAIELDPEYIAKMPEGIIPAHEKKEMDHASDVSESLKWLHGSLPLHYWNEAKSRNVDNGTLKPYQIKKKRL